MPFKCIEPSILYARDPNLKKEDVAILKEWLQKQPHLPQLHETQVLLFLHGCYYRVELAKTIIDNYFTARSLCPELFVALTPEVLETTLSVSFIKILPKKTPEGYGIAMLKLLDFKADNFNCANSINFGNLVVVLYLHQHDFVNGIVAVFDMKGFSLAHLARLNLNVIKHVLYFIQECAPVKIKGIHVINAVPLLDKVVALVKPFLKSEFYNMLQFHSPGSDGLYKSVPKDCLPEEYGGQSPSSHKLNEENLKDLLENYDLLKWHDSQTVDESKRVSKSKITSHIFGADGTFKKLEID